MAVFPARVSRKEETPGFVLPSPVIQEEEESSALLKECGFISGRGAVVGFIFSSSQGFLNQIYFGAASGLPWLSVRPLSPTGFTREEKQWHTTSFYIHSSPFPIKLDSDAESGGYIP